MNTIKQLPIYESMDRRIQSKVRQINKGLRGKSHIVNKGEGYLYIIENSEFSHWFKVGMTKDKRAFENRMGTYKATTPFGSKWNTLYFEHNKDIALEELRVKHLFRYGYGYEMGDNSTEWFRGDWKKILGGSNNDITDTVYIEDKTNTKRDSVYSVKEAKEYIRRLNNK